jgi:cadmium resistance protein CadD (predicted permease)
VTHLAAVVLTAVGAFAGTNVDDFVYVLLVAVGAPPGGPRVWHVIGGQYLGFAALVALSLAGAAVLHAVPDRWVGLFGLIPLALGVLGLVRLRTRPAEAAPPVRGDAVGTIALVTIANGADNISVYVLLFRQLDAAGTAVALAMFAACVAVWCAAALAAAHYARLVPAVARAARWLTPCLFIAIGLIVLLRTAGPGAWPS